MKQKFCLTDPSNFRCGTCGTHYENYQFIEIDNNDLTWICRGCVERMLLLLAKESGLMTVAQKIQFADMAIAGFLCGLEHPYEWLVNYERVLGVFGTDTDILALHDMFLAFMRATEGPTETPLTMDDMFNLIGYWYRRVRDGRTE